MKTITIRNLSTISDASAIKLVECIERGLDDEVRAYVQKQNINVSAKSHDICNKVIYTITDGDEI